MDGVRLDADLDPRTGSRQRTLRRLTDEQLHAALARQAQLEGCAEIDRLYYFADEGVGAAGREAFRPHQHADLAPGRQAARDLERAAVVQRDVARRAHRAVEDVALAHEVGD